MAQKTVVLAMSAARGNELKRALGEQSFEFRPVPHALFSAKGEGVVATLYATGKLVIQGADPELFIERYVGEGAARAPSPSREPSSASPADASAAAFEREPLIGSDECGKGDYFGPLIVAAVRLEAGEAQRMKRGEVRDSKTLSDEACLRLGAALRGQVTHAIARLDPPQYNRLHQRKGQLNAMLADLHAEAIGKLARPGIRVLVDKFADAHLLDTRLAPLGVHLEQRVRAEAFTAVAAASIIAREQFLIALRELGDEFGVDLHKGAGDPVDRSARRFVAIHGMQGLASVAKVHFKNTQKIGESGRG